MRIDFGSLPAPIRWLLIIGGTLMGTFSGLLPIWLQTAGLIAGIALGSFGLLATIWHSVNESRKAQGRPPVFLEPVHLIALALALALVAVCWHIYRGASPSSQTAELQSEVASLKADIEKWVRPREITPDQQETIISYLLARKPAESVEILHYHPDDEATGYAAQINTALTKSDWKTSLRAAPLGAIPGERTMQNGVKFLVEYTPAKRENSRALRILEEAFQAAKVPVRGMGSWTNPDNGDMKLYICVGPRSRR